MNRPPSHSPLKRQQDSIILHFDYDAFYASCFEAETPSLRSKPLCVQQKQILVTCNYEARRRGLHKLQLISEAKRICPDVVVVLGEDLTRFRNVSKQLYTFLKSFSWNRKCERLGFDEVWMDVTDIIEYNVGLLNHHNLAASYFCLSKQDPTAGFSYDASRVAGQTYPEADSSDVSLDDPLRLRLQLGSHLGKYLRAKLHSEQGFTCTVGVSTNKLLSKLVGNLHKPMDQTTLLPPYVATHGNDNVTSFMDGHEVGKIPGIGVKVAQQLRAHVLRRPGEIDQGQMIYSGAKEEVLVGQARQFFSQSYESSGFGAGLLEQILAGPGTPHGYGARVWGLLNGCDDSEVAQARDVPRQISIEDSYRRLNILEEVRKELLTLSKSLLERMHQDLLGDDDDDGDDAEDKALDEDGPNLGIKEKQSSTAPPNGRIRRWVAFPKTIRLSTRPRPPRNPDGSRNRSFARISRSAPMPNFVLSLKESTDSLAERLVRETLVTLFKRLHPQKSGWDLSLINVAATNMVDGASDKEGGVGRDIAKMFRRQDTVLKQWAVKRAKVMPFGPSTTTPVHQDSKGSEDVPTASQQQNLELDDDDDKRWESGDGDDEDMAGEDSHMYICEECGAGMPVFAMGAHLRWHEQGDV
ncbi:DNA/RNA polymerase [Periconia macrospinosa]|uniref:DNA/RNA polymerase n=1 Tax=Periconia macrospinosa TaxID=97972 RepID=A0A2V1E8I1_9PLEO|nr:DNA/RNA polymerase [Periconia macrospinosa]